MLDPSVGVYRVHGKALKDGIVGWVTVAGNQGTLGWHVSYRAGWLANPWAILVYIGFQRCFWCIICVYMIYDIHVYIHSWNIPTGKNKNTHTHLFTVQRLWKHTTAAIPILNSKAQQLGTRLSMFDLGLRIITFGFVSPKKSGKSSSFLVGMNFYPTIRLRNIYIYIPGTWWPSI